MCTNLSHEFLLSCVWVKFLKLRGNRDMRGINETLELKIGDTQGSPSQYYKKSQASKLGDATLGIPHLFVNKYQLAYVEPRFLFVHMMCAILGMPFYFVCCFNKIIGCEILNKRESSQGYLN